MSPEDFKNLAQGLQAIVVGVAVLIGGAWAAYRFWILRSVAKAKEDLEKNQLEQAKLQANISKLQDDLRHRVQGEVSMDIELFGDPVDGEAYLHVRHTISNNGNRAEFIDLTKASVKAASVVPNTKGTIRIGHIVTGQLLKITGQPISVTLIPRESYTRAYLIPIAVPSVYFVEVRVVLSSASAAVVKDARVTALGNDPVEYDTDEWITTAVGDARSANHADSERSNMADSAGAK